MTAAEIVQELEKLATESIKNVLLKHGIPEPVLGVKVEELKKIQRRVKRDYQLSLDLYDTGIYDAMYLAGLIADDRRMTKKDLRKWVRNAKSTALCGTTVSWVAAESLHGWELALEWIDSIREGVAVAGWETLSSLVGIRDDVHLDLDKIRQLLVRIQADIHSSPNRVRYSMNGFVIAVGTHVSSLSDFASQSGTSIGPVTVDVGDTSCKVPYAPESIEKVRKKGAIGKKRKTAKC